MGWKQLVLVSLLAAGGCSTLRTQSHVASGEAPLCASNSQLGRVVVVPETAWRSDQKERDERSAMAERAIRRAFSVVPCAASIDVRGFERWSSTLEGRRLEALSAEGFETALFVRIEELGPTLAITLSLPFLWVGESVTQLSVRAIHMPTSRVLLDVQVDRARGGPFQLRPPAWAEVELESALLELVQAKRD